MLPTDTTAFDKTRQRVETRFLKEFPLLSLSLCVCMCMRSQVSLKAKAVVFILFCANGASTSSLHFWLEVAFHRRSGDTDL